MSDISSRPAAKATDTAAAPSDEGGSPQKPEHSPRAAGSFWSRAARLLRPMQAATLRENLVDALLTDSAVESAFSPEERAMLANILRFREVRVEDIMIPRADIEAVDQSVTIGELMSIFEESGHSRMPVYCETLDDPRGMVHIRDLVSYITRQARNKRRGNRPAEKAEKGEKLAKPAAVGERIARLARADFDLARVDLDKTLAEAGIIRKVLFVPPSMLAADLLQRMQANRTQMALVIDEYGGTDGLASHEDIVELVVGDIEDEHDAEEAMFIRTSEDVLIADARVELEEIAEAIGPDFDISDQIEEVDTLGGLIFAELGRIPARGEVVQALPGFEFHILEADPRRIKKVRIVRKRATARRRPLRGEGEANEAGMAPPPQGTDLTSGAA